MQWFRLFSHSRIVAAVPLLALLTMGSYLPARPAAPAQTGATARAEQLPATLMPRVNGTLAADDPAYAVTPDTATTLRGENPAQQFTATFAPMGVTVGTKATAPLRLTLAAVNDAPSAPVVPVVRAGRVEYHRGDLTEWYVNGPVGLEQGFTLAAPPAADDRVTLTLDIAGATPTWSGDSVLLVKSDGGTLRYSGLTVTDAHGARLPARLDIDEGALTITAETAGAVYPVTVDPFVQAAGLIANDGTAAHGFGSSVAVSANGSVVVVGAPRTQVNGNATQGKAYVYSGTNYTTETPLIASDGTNADLFGNSVAVSADGGTVVVGAFFKATPSGGSLRGKAYVFRGTNYATEIPLLSSDAAVGDSFGNGVAISADGGTVVVGAPGKTLSGHQNQGKAYVYRGANYVTETPLLASDGAAGDFFGVHVAISGDGTTVAVGAYQKMVGGHSGQGKAYVYRGANFTTETPLLASDGATNDDFGWSVATSGDGTTVVVGAINKNSSQGKVYAYHGTNYATETRLSASDGAGSDFFGYGVSISSDGNMIVVGAYHKTMSGHAAQGKAYAYTGTNFATETPLLASDGAASDDFGYSVAANMNGSTVVVGAETKTVNGNILEGKTYVFTMAIVTPQPEPPMKPSGASQSGTPNLLPVRPSGPSQAGSVNLLPARRP